MDKKEENEILVVGMGVLFEDVEIEAQIAENAGISREEYNRIIENELELPECINKYQKINRQRRIYEEKIITHELRKKGELVAKPALIVVFSYYPQFQKEYDILKDNGYLTETENGLKWEKTKLALAQYFGSLTLPIKRKTRPWKAIEILFGENDLKNSFSSNGNEFKNKECEDYKALKRILQG
jgi:hypothetical protein